MTFIAISSQDDVSPPSNRIPPVPKPWTESPAVAGLIAIILYSGFALLELKKHGWDASRFVLAGEQFTDTATAPSSLSVARGSAGYDGQFYYRLALAPLSRAARVGGVRFDYPVYRNQRVLYPALAWLLSGGGRAAAVVWAMLITNILAAGSIAAIAGWALRRLDLPPLGGIIVALHPGFLLTLDRDLVEIVECAFLFAAVVALSRRRDALYAILLSLAVLTKETCLLFAVAVIAARAIESWRSRSIDARDDDADVSDPKRVPGSRFPVPRRGTSRNVEIGTRNPIPFVLFLPFVVYAGWKSFLFAWWHLPFALGAEHFDSSIEQIVRRLANPDPQRLLFIIELAALFSFVVAVALALRSSVAGTSEKIGWLLYLVLMASLGDQFWGEDWGFLRPASEFAVLGSWMAISSTRRWPAAAIVSASWLALAWHVVRFR
jgi:hypothetical protein